MIRFYLIEAYSRFVFPHGYDPDRLYDTVLVPPLCITTIRSVLYMKCPGCLTLTRAWTLWSLLRWSLTIHTHRDPTLQAFPKTPSLGLRSQLLPSRPPATLFHDIREPWKRHSDVTKGTPSAFAAEWNIHIVLRAEWQKMTYYVNDHFRQMTTF